MVTSIADSSADEIRPLRIVCLIPSATDICVHLGLQDSVVGITHCCDTDGLPPSVVIVTEDQIYASSSSQCDINTKVVENSRKVESVVDTSSLTTDEIPTLYPINKELLKKISPTMIVTQDLCHVCAPSSATVIKALNEAGIDAKVVLLTPMNLLDVIHNMQQVADAAGISKRGEKLCDELRENLDKLQSVVKEKRSNRTTKKMLLMEWCNPPFCGGHWVPDMARIVGTELAIQPDSDGRSRRVTWNEIEESDPDLIIVGCCGFDLKRNITDATSERHYFTNLRSNREGNLYAANGDQYFARPSPKLLTGAIIMALCAYSEEEEPVLFRAIKDLPFSSKALESFQRLKL